MSHACGRHLRLWALAVVYAAGLSVATGLIPAWGRWYSASPHLGDQVDALLQGQLALSDDPTALRLDLAWAQGGVQQVWGLGVPLWRVVPEAALRLVGGRDFPGQLAFAAALALTGWLMLRALADPELSAADPARPGAPDWPMVVGGLLVLLYPPFVNLLRSRFDVYEEVVASGNLWGLALAASLVRLASRPTLARAALVGVLAGWGGLVRPTLLLHGAGAMAAAICLVTWRRGDITAQCFRRAAGAGLGLLLAGAATLYATNHARFGDGFSFGHELNLQYLSGSLYATRFDDPYADEPIPSAARELFGFLFRARGVVGSGFDGQDPFPGQSATVRWRESYLSTYDRSHLLLMIGSVILVSWHCRRLWRRRQPADNSRPETRSAATAAATLAVYGVVSAALLAAFYLRSPVISSRYMLDFMPSFTAILLAGWLVWRTVWRARPYATAVLALSLTILAAWTLAGVRAADGASPGPRVLTRAEFAVRHREPPSAPVVLPACGCYTAAGEPSRTGIPFNGAGWWSRSGLVQSCVILFIDEPAFLELEIAARDPEATPKAPESLRARVGLEFLDPESTRRTADGWTVRFQGPRSPRFRRGLQPAFIATVPPAHLADRETPWRLVRVRWRNAAAQDGS